MTSVEATVDATLDPTNGTFYNTAEQDYVVDEFPDPTQDPTVHVGPDGGTTPVLDEEVGE